MLLDTLTVDPAEFQGRTGWAAKPQGLCKGDRCVPVPGGTGGQLDVRLVAERLGMPLLHDEGSGLWALGPEAGGRALTTAVAPDLELPTVDGDLFALSSLRGRKVLIATWASWCGCRLDLPMWQALRAELHPQGLEIVTVALDTGGAEAARPWIEAAKPEHPSLIDRAHVTDELLGFVNVPNGVWVDEEGVLVRPAEPAWPPREPASSRYRNLPDDLTPRMREMLTEAAKLRTDPEGYTAAVRDWVANGAASRFALSPDEVVARSQPRPVQHAEAAAAFELGQHLWRAGDETAAISWFRQAQRLHPDNWTYKRQSWVFVDPQQGPTEHYDSDWLSDVRAIGAENYYPTIRW
jgi:peroxiredoxin